MSNELNKQPALAQIISRNHAKGARPEHLDFISKNFGGAATDAAWWLGHWPVHGRQRGGTFRGGAFLLRCWVSPASSPPRRGRSNPIGRKAFVAHTTISKRSGGRSSLREHAGKATRQLSAMSKVTPMSPPQCCQV